MAHEKVFAICENKCFVETNTKKQFDDLKRKVESYLGSSSLDDEVSDTVLVKNITPKTRLRYYQQLSVLDSPRVDAIYIATQDAIEDNNGELMRLSPQSDLIGFIENNEPLLSEQNTGFIEKATLILKDGTKHAIQEIKSNEYLKEFGSMQYWFFDLNSSELSEMTSKKELFNNIEYLVVERCEKII